MTEEMAFHEEMLVRDARSAGLGAEDARSVARRRFGNTSLLQEQSRDLWTLGVLDTVQRDMRFALRTARRSPALTVALVLTLALGLGPSITVFSLVDAIILRALPVDRPDRLVLVNRISPTGATNDQFPLDEVEYIRTHAHALDGLIAFDYTRLNVVIDRSAEPLEARLVSGNIFALLGVRTLGRPLTPDDDQPGRPPVAVISCAYWQRRFGASQSALNRTLVVNGRGATIVGIMPCSFPGLSPGELPEDLWLPMALHSNLALNDHTTVGILGRLAPGRDPASAAAELTALHRTYARDLATTAPVGNRAEHIGLASGAQGLRDLVQQAETPLRLLSGVALAVLLIVSANVTNLLLTRATARRRELAVRLALGASRRRIAGQLVTETAVYAAAGAVLGVLLAWWAAPILARYFARDTRGLLLDLLPRARTIAFAAAAMLATAFACGFAPALIATRLDLQEELKESARIAGGSATIRLGRALAAAQVALSLLLLAITSQLVHGVGNLAGMDPGFDRGHVLLFGTYATALGLSGTREIQLYELMQQRLAALPGVRAASMSRFPAATVLRRVCLPAPVGQPATVNLDGVGTRYFETVGIPLLRGRDFTPADTRNGTPVAILSQEAARVYFPGVDPVGRILDVDVGAVVPGVRALQVIGVAGDVRAYGPAPQDVGAPICTVFIPLAQAPHWLLGQMTFEVRAANEPAPLFAAVRSAVHSVNADLSLFDLRTAADDVRALTAGESVLATLAGAFGTLALLLACVGLYGVVSYAVSRRTGELGVRLALGARPSRLHRTVVRDAMRPVAVGLAVGLAATLVALRLTAHAIFGLSTPEPLAIAVAAATLLAAALTAAHLPARRASRIDPVRALHTE
jgi:predicted permease